MRLGSLSLHFGRPPLALEASRESTFRLVRSTTDEPLYFFVPQGTESFVLRVHSAGSPESDIRVYGPNGDVVSEHIGIATGRDLSGRAARWCRDES